MAEKKYRVENGVYIELTAEELQDIADRVAEADLDFQMVRSERDGKLASSDWTQIADAELGDHTAEEWAAYRKKLRDLPATSNAGSGGKVSEVVWPDDPPTAKAKE